MQQVTMMLLCLLLSVLLISTASSREDDPAKEARIAVNSALNDFTVDLYQVARAAQEGNMVLSPLSASIALVLMWLGAIEDSKEQLGDALHLEHDKSLVTSGYQELVNALQNGAQEALVRVANGLFVAAGAQLKPNFARAANESFLAHAQELDFAGQPEEARDTVNRWAKEHTDGKITDLVAPGSYSDQTFLVIVNAIYFKAGWANKFSEERTSTETFYVTTTTKVYVPMMHGRFQMDYQEFPELDALGISLDYYEYNIEMKMRLLLPNNKHGLEALEASLLNFNMEKISKDRWDFGDVDVTLPKFRIENKHDVKKYLQKMGVIDLFVPHKAKLRYITDDDLYVSSVIQKTFIEVNENGTEAAAVTEVRAQLESVFQEVSFRADHPFMFFVVVDGNILFLGRVTDPSV